MSFGTNLQTLRGAKNMSQEELADALNVSRQCISKWELDSAYPETEKLIALGQYFHVKIDDLLTGTVLVEMGGAQPPNCAAVQDAEELPHSARNRKIRYVLGVCLILMSPFYPGSPGANTAYMAFMALFFTAGLGLIIYNLITLPKRKKA